MKEEERECRMHALHRVYQPAIGQGNLKACVGLHYLPTYHRTGTTKLGR